MDFRVSPEVQQFGDELHALLDRLVTLEVIEEAESVELGPRVRGVLRELGARGWLAPAWPVEQGGVAATPTHTAIVEDALAYYRLLPAGRLVGIGIAGPMIMRFGSADQQRRFLPAIARGEIEFCLAYTEPEAGSDLGALQTRAARDGDDYVIEGHKLFNTRAHYAEYHWLIARTDPSTGLRAGTTGGRREGYSFFIVDSKSAGIVVQPLVGLSGKRTNAVFYDKVRVPAENLVGEEGRGWEYMTSAALAFERVFPVGDIEREFEELLAALRGRGPLPPYTRQRLAELAIKVGIARLLSWRITWMQSRGIVPGYEADALKLFHSELWQSLASTALSLLGQAGMAADGRAAYNYLDTQWRTVAGGTSEVVRNLIATRGLGLPRR